MALYASVEESWERHRGYNIDTEEEGKYERNHWGVSRAHAIVDEVELGSMVLEMGCNSGGLSVMLMRKGCLLYGVDVAPVMVAKAQAKGIRAKVAPAEKVPFEDEYFNVVIASEILEHVYEPQDLLKEARRVLKPGGLLVGTVPHDKSYNTGLCDIREHYYHARIYTEDGLAGEVGKQFEKVCVSDICFHKPPPGTPIPVVQLKALNSGKPQWYLFTARKRS